jgi:hypothetical protein
MAMSMSAFVLFARYATGFLFPFLLNVNYLATVIQFDTILTQRSYSKNNGHKGKSLELLSRRNDTCHIVHANPELID